MNNQTNFIGSWTGTIGFLVLILQHFGIVISQNDALTVIAGLVVIYGIIRQAVDHKKLGITAIGNPSN